MVSRLLLLRRYFLVGLGLVLLRLMFLQLVQGAMYRQLAEHNRLRLVPQPAPRGVIVDRLGRHLAANHLVFHIAAVPQDLRDRPDVFAKLSRLVHVPPSDLERRFQDQRTLPFVPATLLKDVEKATAFRIEEARLELPGVVVTAVTARAYPFGDVAAHLLGYVGQPSAEEFPLLKRYGVKPQDLVGKAGVEQELEGYLRGEPGGSLIEVDHRARQVRVMGQREPVPGQAVSLTIDAELQALIQQAFGAQPGAAVVLRPQTGEALAVVSSPEFEPEAFSAQEVKRVRAALTDDRSPMLDRAAHGLYMPGSIAKIVTSMTALEHRVMQPDTPVTCPGFLTIGDRQFRCWNHDGHGVETMRGALRDSCNVYFMEVGRHLGLERLRTGFLSLGFGHHTGWLLGDDAGHVPGGRRLTEGEVAIFAIGQGELLITPLQAALMASAVANGGWLVEPWVVRRVGDATMGRPHLTSLGWSREHLAVVREGMLAVVNDPHGTGHRAHSDHVVIAGKTGTAQTHQPGHPHGWFVGFCPADHPVAAMAVVAEHGGSGGDLPASIGKAVCEYLVAHPLDVPSGAPSDPA